MVLISSRYRVSSSSSILNIGTSSDIQRFVEENQFHLSSEDLVRRHSLSLRSPPLGSLASEILNTPSYQYNQAKSKTLISDLKEIADKLSEFRSCKSSVSSSDSEREQFGDNDGFQTMNSKKRGWKNKRKLKTTPRKESLLKKQK